MLTPKSNNAFKKWYNPMIQGIGKGAGYFVFYISNLRNDPRVYLEEMVSVSHHIVYSTTRRSHTIPLQIIHYRKICERKCGIKPFHNII